MSVLSNLKDSPHQYLYAFISPNAKLSTEIMTKRVKQIQDLQAIAKVPFMPSVNEMVSALREGFQTHYGKTPEQILTILYYSNAGGGGVSGVTGTHFDGATGNWVDDATGEVLCEDQQVLQTQIADSNSGESETVGFWDACSKIVEWIVSLLKALGINKNSSEVSTYTPTKTDWTSLSGSGSTSEAGFGI
ncbi:MAG: hypothetical protein RIS29_2506, partial [Bacteroidota bacterium]